MNESEITVHISAKTLVKFGLFISIVFALYFLRDLVVILLMSAVFATSIEPITAWLQRYKIPRAASVFTMFAVTIATFFSIVYLFVPIISHEINGFINAIPKILDSINVFGTDVSGSDGLKMLIGGDGTKLTGADIINAFREVTPTVGEGAATTANAFFSTLTKLVLITVISFYLAVQERGIEQFLRVLTPKRHEKYVISLWLRSQHKIAKWMQGQLVLGIIIGVLVYLGLSVLGVPYALLLAILAAVFELIPLFGPILAMVPGILIAFSQGSSNIDVSSGTLALIVAVFYLIVQQLENQLIYPLVVKQVVGVNPLIVIISLLVGAKLAGFWGLLLAVPVAAALMEFVDDIQKEKYITPIH